MPRMRQTDPAAQDRLRRARAAEDDAFAAVTSAQAALDAAAEKRRLALVALDGGVADAEARLTEAQAELVGAAGLDRVALVLGMTVPELRKKITPRGHANGSPRSRPAPAEDGQILAHPRGAL